MNEIRKRQKRPSAAREAVQKSAITEKTVEQQLAWAAGTEQFSHRDPMFHLTETFKQVFDALGGRGFDRQEDTTGLFGRLMKDIVPGITDALGRKESDAETQTQSEKAAALDKTSMDSLYKQRDTHSGDRMMTKFSEVTFNRGVLAGAILNGTGQMMLFNCLKRTVGQSQPKTIFQKKLFQQSSAHSLIKGYPQDKLVFNKGFTDSAVGLVVDVLRDSRRVVDSLTEIVSGTATNARKGNGADTLEKMYPFLSTAKEQSLLAEYDAALAECPEKDNDRRQMLIRAKQRVTAVIDKKTQMKTEFVSKLRYISESAQKAQTLFSTEDFRQSLFYSLVDYLSAVVPPPDDDDDDDEGEENDGKDRQLHKKSSQQSRRLRKKRKEE